MYTVSKEDQIKELINRVPPIINIDLVIFKKNKDDIYSEPEYLLWKKHLHINLENKIERIFPGWRMNFDETPEEAINRISQKEVPWVVSKIKKLVTAISDKWYDHRAYGITLEYLLEYQSWEPIIWKDEFIEFKWMKKKGYGDNPMSIHLTIKNIKRNWSYNSKYE